MSSTQGKEQLSLDNEENETPNIVRVTISTPFGKEAGTPSSGEIVAAGRRISVPDIENVDDSCERSPHDSSSEMHCELESVREQLQQALDDKAELIEESLLDKERIKDQKETIELLTKRIREFEMSRPSSSVASAVMPPARSRSATSQAMTNHVKQLSEDNIQLAKEVDRLLSERDRLEKKLIDIKIKYANGYLTRQNSGISTDEDELDSEGNVFTTLSVDEKLKRKKGRKVLGASSTSKSGVFSTARSWFSRKSTKSPIRSSKTNSATHSRSNEAGNMAPVVHTTGVAV